MSIRGWAAVAALLIGVGLAGCDRGSDGQEPAAPPARTYANPISLPDEWGEYGLGDPFIFKYDGYYYLYVSTRDTDAGVKVWQSANLLDWTYKGLCTDDPLTAAAYAPEVRYWNGKFYMYTSPAGQGHYALVGDSPTGPFKVASDNFGRTIDGTTFVDDDGKWYFYYAGPLGIQGAPMSDPLTVEAEEAQTGASMDGWTEGPTVFKRGGKYYMTYTGNHVFSAGYRVNAAVSAEPLQGYEPFDSNPVLLRTEGATVGLGHNSVVRGPDLDTDYMIYHNLEGHGVVGPLRHMNMDRIVWNGDRFAVWGPTSEPQPAPAPPTFEDRFERAELGKAWQLKGGGAWSLQAGAGLIADAKSVGGGAAASRKSGGKDEQSAKADGPLAMLLAKPEAAADFTAEYHVQLRSAGRAGAVFAYRGADDYGVALLDAKAKRLRVDVYRGGKPAEHAEAALPADVDPMQLHELRLEKAGPTLRAYVDEMLLAQAELKSPLKAGRIGYAADGAEARFGYVAFSDSVDGGGSRSAYAPLPGAIDAIHAEEAADAARLGGDGSGGYVLAGLKQGDKLTYRVNVARDGAYSLAFRVKPGADGAEFKLASEGAAAAPAAASPTAAAGASGDSSASASASSPASAAASASATAVAAVRAAPSGAAGEWQFARIDGVALRAGMQTLTLKVERGSLDLASVEAWPYAQVEAAEDGFDDKNDFGWTRYEGEWSVRDGKLKASSVQPAKSLWGDDGWTDYVFEADMTVPEAGGSTGLLVRATNPANGLELNQNRTDFVQGYAVMLDASGLHLDKLDYGTAPLADAVYAAPAAGETLHLKVRAAGTRLAVYVGDAAEPALDYEDRSGRPFLHGKVGFRSIDTVSRFDEARIAPVRGDVLANDTSITK